MSWAGPAMMCLLLAMPGTCAGQGQSPTRIYENAHVSVVVVVVLDQELKPSGQGSGFIIGKDRIVTNHHVIDGAAAALVLFADGRTEEAEGIIADNATRDLAILVVKTGSRRPLKLGDELAVKPGDSVYALGAPRGLELSITNGILSGFRDVDSQFLLQTTAAIAPGSSGGPLFDSSGLVIGVTTSLLSDSPGIYFSVGARDVSRLMRTTSIMVPLITSRKIESESRGEPQKHNDGSENGSVDRRTDRTTAAKVYKGNLEDEIAEKGLDGRVFVSVSGDTVTLTGKLHPADHAVLLKFMRNAPANVRVVDDIVYDNTPVASAESGDNGAHPVPGKGRSALHVVTDVIGANATLIGPDGRKLFECQTPCSFNNLDPAEYRLQVRKDGYVSVQTALQTYAGETQDQKVHLESVAKGLFISSHPANADVFINGVKQSGQTPVTLPLAAGQYDVVIRLSGYEPYAGHVKVEENVQTKVEVELKEKTRVETACLRAPRFSWTVLLLDRLRPLA
jgi:hypothetical protein